jgi:hypothetical protein
LHIKFVHFQIKIPDSVAIQRWRRPPPGWHAEPPEKASMRYGSTCLRRGRLAVLELPSAIVPSEMNYLLRPTIPTFARSVWVARCCSYLIRGCGSSGGLRSRLRGQTPTLRANNWLASAGSICGY